LTKKHAMGTMESFVVTYPVDRPMDGRPLTEEAKELIGPLLNSVYDVEELKLDHKRVKLDRITKANLDPLTFEIYGVNDICEHTELNTFKMTITRNVDERSRPSYSTVLVHPYSEAP
ncbi:MAG TPA: hypothetical protein VEL47_00780, partial [Myxococcota bacterium]|nr:hypothetical protein [Myxococcota bacterium]